MPAPVPEQLSQTIETLYRSESGRVLATLVRLLGDLDLAEEAMHEAFTAALEFWSQTGIPDKPRPWLISTARFKAIDVIRRRARFDRAQRDLIAHLESRVNDAPGGNAETGDAEIEDDRLRLIFTCCHPALPPEGQVALTLREVCGLTTEEIARAFLIPEPTVAQRIVRAKRTLSESGLAYETPRGEELSERLASVLEVVYLVFNEGYTAARGDEWHRPQLCNEALRLGRMLTAIAPQEPETHALLALMELNASRSAARIDAKGDPVLLMEQNRVRWDQLQIGRGMRLLKKVGSLGGAGGFYALQAAIVACHARASGADDTDWRAIATLYEELLALIRSPVIELNRAVAVGMADGPVAGLAIVEALVEGGELRNYHLLPTVRGDLLERLGRHEEARAAFETAAGMTANTREQEMLKRRAAAAASRTAR
jgi:RNA polymerase sigma factor (sigma-70 family)